jgi:Sel1 repeat
MKRTLGGELLPTPSQRPQPELPPAIPPDTTAEQAQSEPTLFNRTVASSSMEMVSGINQPPIQPSEHSAPEKIDRSTSASSAAISATKGDEIMSLKKAADQGHAKAQFNLGLLYYIGEGVEANKEQAFMWFHKAAVQGDLKAQFNLGVLYTTGKGVEVDKEKGFMWFHKAAVEGYSKAQFNLGLLYSTGKGVEVDKEKAAMWFRKAAEQGDSKAQLIVGAMHEKGEGIEVDEEKAFMWFHKAAEQDLHDAQYRVSEYYQKGIGVVEDLPLAAYWLLKALRSTIDTSIVISLDHHSELIKLVPSILEKYSEFKDMHKINFYSDNFFWGDEEITAIAEFIRSNSKIKDFEITYPAEDMSDVHFSELVEALKFNTNLTLIKFPGSKLSSETAAQIELLLTRNRDIAELRQYVEMFKIQITLAFPLDIVKLMVDKMIVAYFKIGQTKEATRKAIDEFLLIARTPPLAKDSKIT